MNPTPFAILPLLPNRVRRNYLGGRALDLLEGREPATDSNQPEDWLASTICATNPGLEPIAGEGLGRVSLPGTGTVGLPEVLAANPEYYLGTNHVSHLGLQLGFLAKLLDSAIRLHVQAHPTATFAQQHLNSRWGKLETYVILGVRPGIDPYIRLGFQRPPSPQEWKRIVVEQDIPAMDACFDRIPIRPGEVWLVPGGLPHAIGEGVLMLEVMEPSDLVVRCEFEREGIIVPPNARFMQREVDFALQIFDYTPLSTQRVIEKYRIAPRRISDHEELLIGPEQTSCFSIRRLTLRCGDTLPPSDRLRIGIVATGQGTLEISDQCLALSPGHRFLLAAAAPVGRLQIPEDETLELLICLPGNG
jgi:mannose-6-phosphate isomerase